MMRRCVLIAILIVTGIKSFTQQYFYNAQYYDAATLYEAGISLAAMNCFTDIGGRSGTGKSFLKDLNIKNTKPAISVYADLLYNYIWGLRFEYTIGHVCAYDSILQNDFSEAKKRYQRNLHFKSLINEISLIGEWYLLEQIHSNRGLPSPVLSPYILAGIGFYTFKPKAKWKDQWIELRPLHTEGQGFSEYADRKEYSLKQINFPLGIGFKYEASARCWLRLEVIHRILFTDYLDDVSEAYIDPLLFNKYLNPQKAEHAFRLSNRQNELDSSALYIANQRRGNPSRKDSYFTINLKMGILINRKRR